MKIGPVLVSIHRSEMNLYHDLLQLSARYVTEPEVHHVAKDLAQWSRNHIAKLAEIATDYGEALQAETSDARASKHAEQHTHSESLGIDNPSGLALLWDLRTIHMTASGIAVQWTMLSQGAKALQQSDLLSVVTQCQPETQRQQTWAQAQIKQLSPQVLSS
ncbi:hypothetical protein [Enteractinococcus coprophilus]|uniref:Ferritin-like metal-binding protein YciE n=1 Tax=Enteractinococcus coprophilus TaxID=1027633 RepID=A0A543AGN6_9MICC|nr:hypothetical protein [Enteractinococcus coprophilus]TQL71739.1 hypothetical protein FB556_2240 [Enteractinococcus coprophilus]